MSDLAIHVENLTKRYKIGGRRASYRTFRETLLDSMAAPVRWMRGEKRISETFSALDDVSFEVKQGDTLGIIGRNGAGKSTLLKLLSRITRPSSGSIKLYGRVASLLEVGTGFHPELSGRDNIYLNGAILGMSRGEISRKFDEIVDFSGVEKFLDTPVKHYSSGMYVRLAFAVAAHLEPEILVVDEVLAVGDAEFQKKCLGKMGEVAHAGKTVLFVSHNISAINSLCRSGLVLEKGQAVFNGSAADSVRYYLDQSVSGADDMDVDSGIVEFPVQPEKPIQIRKVSLADSSGNTKSMFDFQENATVKISFDLRVPNHDYYASLVVVDIYGNWVYFLADDDLLPSKLSNLEDGEYCYSVRLPEKLLKPGKYYLIVSLTGKNGQGPFDRHDNALSLTVIDQFTRRGEKNGYRSSAIVAPEIEWVLHPISKE